MRLAFLTQLWNAKIDFSESLMTGEVKNLEATLNVRPFHLLLTFVPLTYLSSIALLPGCSYSYNPIELKPRNHVHVHTTLHVSPVTYDVFP